jgi:hypothetical protein
MSFMCISSLCHTRGIKTARKHEKVKGSIEKSFVEGARKETAVHELLGREFWVTLKAHHLSAVDG